MKPLYFIKLHYGPIGTSTYSSDNPNVLNTNVRLSEQALEQND